MVTGASERVAEVSSALRKAGAEVIAVDDLGKLDAALAGLPPGSLDRYIQMPVHVAARGETVVERVRHFLGNGLPALQDGCEIAAGAWFEQGSGPVQERWYLRAGAGRPACRRGGFGAGDQDPFDNKIAMTSQHAGPTCSATSRHQVGVRMWNAIRSGG